MVCEAIDLSNPGIPAGASGDLNLQRTDAEMELFILMVRKKNAEGEI